MENYKNYNSLNTSEKPEEKNWCVSVKMQKKILQISVKADTGRTYHYGSRFPVEEGNVVIIGNQLPNCSGIGINTIASSGRMGIAFNILPKLEIKRNHAGELDFVFAEVADKKMITACTKLLDMEGNEKTLQYDKLVSDIYPITFYIRKILAAASVIANSKLAGNEAVEKATAFIHQKHIITESIKELYTPAPWYPNINLCDIHVNVNGKNEKELVAIRSPLMDANKVDGNNRFNEYRTTAFPKSIDEYVNKYSNIGAVSIMLRGGFVNLLKAYLSTNPPIISFYDEMLESIGENALPQALKILKEHTFDSSNQDLSRFQISSINIPEGTQVIEENAFKDCSKLSSITLPSTLKVIDKNAFADCFELSSIIIPEGVEIIGENAFKGCRKLNSITLPSTLKVIDKNVFNECSNLSSIIIPEGVEIIDENAFKTCRNLKKAKLPSTLKTIGKNAFAECSNISSIDIPKGVETIEENAFALCQKLRSVTFPSTLIRLGGQAFSECSELRSIAIPEGVKTIGENAFGDCNELTTAKLPSTLKVIASKTFFKCKKLNSVDIPEGIEVVGNGAFYSCTKLPVITLPSTLKIIGDNAFSHCSLIEVVIPEGVVEIGRRAFASCQNLSSITFPSTLKMIGDNAFYSCSQLEEIVIPEGVEDLGGKMFYNCKLRKLTLPSTLKKMSLSIFHWSSIAQLLAPHNISELIDAAIAAEIAAGVNVTYID